MTTNNKSTPAARVQGYGDHEENLVVIAGRVRVEPILRSSTSDEVLLTFDLVTGEDVERRTVPVSWQGPPRSVPKVAPDDQILVLGTVQRRFFRAGGTTAHATDVRADMVARTPAAKRRLLVAAVGRLDSFG